MLVLVTGATGFIGHALVQQLQNKSGISLRAALRRNVVNLPSGVDSVQVSDLSSINNWEAALSGVDVVIHAAARVHVIRDNSFDPLTEFRRVNVEGTLNLARQAATERVHRFIFISSIGVNGAQSSKPFSETDIPNPTEPYAISKLEAENSLLEMTRRSSMELVIIRPPLVYGPGAPGNFARLYRAVERGIPLPLGAINNRRSFIGLDNLVDLIVTCVDHPAAANQIFLAGENADLSTTEFLQKLGIALGKPARLFPVPAQLLILIATLIGKKAEVERLSGSLQVDISKARALLGWEPPISVDEGFRRAADAFKS